MNSFLSLSKRCIYIVTAILAGLFLFLFVVSFSINGTVLKSDFHKNLFERNNVYSHTQSAIQKSMSDFVNNLKKHSPEDFSQHTDVFSLLEKSFTPDMVKLNLNSVREGLFQYFEGKNMFLPDIYLNPPAGNSTFKSETSKDETIKETKDTSTQAFTKIEKINLSAVLLYINRSDISDFLFETKFVYYVANKVPTFSLIILIILFILGLLMCKRISEIIRWTKIFLITCSSLGLISGIALLIYSYTLLSNIIYPINMSLPLPGDVILSYMRDCITPISYSLIISSLFLVFIAIGVSYLRLLFPSLCITGNTNNERNTQKKQRYIRNSIYISLCLLMISSCIYNVQVFKSDFNAYDFSIAISKMKNANKVTEVIAAKNEAIYALHIKLLDSKTNKPIPNTQINISGKSSLLEKNYDEISTTDDSGIAKFNLDKGPFRASFLPSSFPTEYQIPSPFFLDLKSAGTTIVTVNLDLVPVINEEKWGIVEIEVLSNENKPVSSLELSIDGVVLAPGHPDNLSSYTNSEGIAVFKINEGNYKINFKESKFPSQYIIPPPIDVTSSPDLVGRYTIRLVNSQER